MMEYRKKMAPRAVSMKVFKEEALKETGRRRKGAFRYGQGGRLLN
jgi:hypothetical protein